MLAHMDREEVAEIAPKHGLDRNTPNTIGSLRQLHADLGRIRERGYSINDEEFAIGLRCVAAPIFNERGITNAAVSIAGPSTRIFDEGIAELGPMVGDAARSVTIELGGSVDLPAA